MEYRIWNLEFGSKLIGNGKWEIGNWKLEIRIIYNL